MALRSCVAYRVFVLFVEGSRHPAMDSPTGVYRVAQEYNAVTDLANDSAWILGRTCLQKPISGAAIEDETEVIPRNRQFELTISRKL